MKSLDEKVRADVKEPPLSSSVGHYARSPILTVTVWDVTIRAGSPSEESPVTVTFEGARPLEGDCERAHCHKIKRWSVAGDFSVWRARCAFQQVARWKPFTYGVQCIHLVVPDSALSLWNLSMNRIEHHSLITTTDHERRSRIQTRGSSWPLNPAQALTRQ